MIISKKIETSGADFANARAHDSNFTRHHLGPQNRRIDNNKLAYNHDNQAQLPLENPIPTTIP